MPSILYALTPRAEGREPCRGRIPTTNKPGRGRLPSQALRFDRGGGHSMPDAVAAQADHSRFVQRIRRRYAAELPLLPPGARRRRSPRWCRQLQHGGRDAGVGACAWRASWCWSGWPCWTSNRRAAGRDHRRDDRPGRGHAGDRAGPGPGRGRRAPRRPARRQGQRIDFWIVGMGKLGARELNVSSDIDLIYVYEDDGQTDGAAAGGAGDPVRTSTSPGGQAAVRADRRHHRRRLRLPRRPGAAPQRQFRARRWSAWACWRSTSRSRAASGSALPG
jgi:hypothetical protein